MALQRLLDETDYSGAAALQSKMREESATTKSTAEGSTTTKGTCPLDRNVDFDFYTREGVYW